METLLLLLVLPLVWPFIAKAIWRTTISYQEMAIQIVVVSALVVGVYQGGVFGQMADTEILNGEITGKARTEVSCVHSYDCNCSETCTGSGSDRSCYTTCDTCYDHSYDVDWRVHTNLSDFNIARIDRQGLKQPPRWDRVVKGQPYSETNMHMNYVKAAPESLFNQESSLLQQYAGKLPNYPDNVYDYQYVDRVLAAGVPVPDLGKWNLDLANTLKVLGPSKQANAIVVFTKEASPTYADALEEKWVGGKKNDIVVVIGTTKYPTIDWVRIISWTDNQLFKVQLRDAIQTIGTIDRQQVIQTINEHTLKSFKRKPMADFEYLKDEIEPPGWVIIAAILVAIVSSAGGTLFFHRNEVDFFRRKGYNPKRKFKFRR